MRDKDIHFVGCGISGGEEGALNGPSIMPGGSKQSYESLGPILEKISAHVDGEPCCTHIGTDGAGHFVKMVHNGIEYADMQLIAEAYDLLRRAGGLEPAEIAAVFEDWNSGELDSFLIEITAQVLAHVDAATGKPFVDVVLDAAGMKGTGTWTVQTALDLGIPVSGIAEAVFARGLSSSTEQRAAAVGVLPGPRRPGRSRIATRSSRTYGARCTPRRSSPTPRVSTRSPPAQRNTAGTSTAVRSPGSGAAAASSGPGSSTGSPRPTTPPPRHRCRCCSRPYFTEAVGAAQASWRRVVAGAAQSGIPTPGFSAALAYYDGLRSERLPAALIQGQRDFFGAHTYRRVDRDGVFHTLWSGDRTEVES